MNKIKSGTESKIFDPRDPSSPARGNELLDPTIALRNGQWWLYVAGQPHEQGAPNIFSASLPARAPLSASGWQVIRDAAGEPVPLASSNLSAPWDANGGRHCPSYVVGWDPRKSAWVERIYYAGAAEHIWGPYTIGFLEWDGQRWLDQPEPVFVANAAWEHGSVYEPNLIFHDGKWKLWYVAGSNREDYLVHGYSESADGRTGWTAHEIFAPPEMKMFDFCVRPRGESFDAIFSRVSVGPSASPPETGLWWCCSSQPSGRLSDWSQPIQIMTAENRGWHSGPFKPSFHIDDRTAHAFIFFGGSYRTTDPGPFPFVFTTGCLELDLPTG
ncbi:MAG TPA: hypothetical protein VMH00_09105 [Candidatus Limnocylindrales bacterium]|nr:hypothetical protein [Candidatus Limnocylindrales bacterium]